MTIITRTAKGSELTHAELDANFTELNTLKAADSAVVHLTGTETIAGAKTFSTRPVVGTATAGTNDTAAASTAYVVTAIAALVASSPAALDTLNELAAALGNDASFATTVTNALAGKAPKPTTRSVSAASDTLLTTDGYNVVDYTNTGAIAVSITTAMNGLPSVLTWPASAGTITITPTGVTLNGSASALVLSAAGGAVSLIPIGTNAFRVIGSIGELALADISDMSANARTFNSAADYAAMRAALGVGTGGGDASTNTASSVDSELALFSGTAGKTLKRATGSGVAKLTSGVLGTGAVALSEMANLAQDQFIGRTTASTGVPETATITAAARTVLDDTTVAAMVDTLGGAASTGTGGLARTSSPSFTTPRVVTALADANGNEVFDVTATASAVNQLAFVNSPTGSAVQIATAGGDTNIALNLAPKGTGAVQIKGQPISFAGSFTTAGAFAVTMTFTGTTGITVPVSGVLASLSLPQAFTARQSVTTVGLTDGATVSTDAALSNKFRVTLGGNRTLANPTNLADGQPVQWRVTQDATGSRTLAYGSAFKWPGGTAPTLTTAANAVDLICCEYDSTSATLMCNIVKDIK